MPIVDAQQHRFRKAADPQAAQGNFEGGVWVFGELTCVVATCQAPRPTAPTGDRCGLALQPHQAMGWQRNRCQGITIELGPVIEPPGAAVLAVFQQQIEVATPRIIRGTGVFQNDVAQHRGFAFRAPSLTCGRR